jgi:hypothetical protein
MHKACPLSERVPGEALRLDTAPPVSVFRTGRGGIVAGNGNTTVSEPDGPPNIPSGLKTQGRV